MRQQETPQSEIIVLVPTGMLGGGFKRENMQYGISRGAHAIAVDSGSTDSGPAYLARAVSKMSRDAVKRDLQVLMAEAHRANIPLLVGSCGTGGTDAGVDWTLDIALEVAHELDIEPRIARLYSEQTPADLVLRNGQGKVTPLVPLGPVADEVLESCDHIVALMGVEPYIRALQDGA